MVTIDKRSATAGRLLGGRGHGKHETQAIGLARDRGSNMAAMTELHTDQEIARVLRATKTIAVLGVHHEASRPAFYVPEYLHARGYRILGVNPVLAREGRALFGEPVRGSLVDLDEVVDMIDVFRRPELLPGHLDEILGMKHRPRVVWLQLGIRNDAFAAHLQAEGIDVVQDRCTLADHRRLGL